MQIEELRPAGCVPGRKPACQLLHTSFIILHYAALRAAAKKRERPPD